MPLNTSVSFFEGMCYNALAYVNITVYYTNWANGDANTPATADIAAVRGCWLAAWYERTACMYALASCL